MANKPLIIDEVIGQPIGWGLTRAPREELFAVARQAERFVFSDAASALIGQFAIECGDLVLHHRQFAIPPFNPMYIEFSKPFFTTFQNVGFPDGTDNGVGYLLSGKRIYIVSRGRKSEDTNETTLLSPFYYTWSLPDEGKALLDPKTRGIVVALGGEDGIWAKLACAYGSSQMRITDEDERQALLDQCQAHIFRDYIDRLQASKLDANYVKRGVQLMLANSAGDVRNVWAALLWLNRPAHTVLSNQPAGRRFLRGKSVAFRAHHTVEIDLHKRRSLRRAFVLSGERLSPRRHKVRGAFHHMHGSPGCSHDWPLMPDDDLHWKCKRCGRVRWWVKDHQRGDLTRGWVDHSYEVTTGEGAKP